MSRPSAFLIHTGIVLSCLTVSQAATVFVDGRAGACGNGQTWPTAAIPQVVFSRVHKPMR